MAISSSLVFFMNLVKTQTIVARRFDCGLGGLGFSELMILYHLSQAPETKLRRIDLAEKIGLTASGVTRLLLPMEKIGLVSKEAHARDARVSYVVLAPGGAEKLREGLERAELFCADVIPAGKVKKVEELSTTLVELSQAIKY